MLSFEPAAVRLTLADVPNDATATLYDGQDRPVVLDREGMNLTATVPRGLYNVRITRFGRMAEQVIRLSESAEIRPEVPGWYTSAPLRGAASSHEYYSDTAADVSRKDTRAPIGQPGATGRLFIFVRALDHKAATDMRAELGTSLVLRDAQGRIVARLDPTETALDAGVGWVALSAPATPGFYALHDTSTDGREAALHVFDGWQTQVFILHQASPRLETMRVFLARAGQGFHPDDREACAIDLALGALQTGVDSLSDDYLQLLLGGKFSNPMLGLVGAHVLLRRWRQRGSAPDPGLLTVILDNLGDLLPGSADVAALRLMSAPFLGKRPDDSGFYYPPMLRAGLTTIIDASAQAPVLVPEEGLIDDIATRVLADSPWATWTPLGAAWPAAEVPETPLTGEITFDEAEPMPIQFEPEVFDVFDAESVDDSVGGLDIDFGADAGLGGRARRTGPGPTAARNRGAGRTPRKPRISIPKADRFEITRERDRPTWMPEFGKVPTAPASSKRAPQAPQQAPLQDDWVHVALVDAAIRAGHAVRRGRLDTKPESGIGWMARQLGVTPRVIRRTAASWLERPETELVRAIRNAAPAADAAVADVTPVVRMIHDLGRSEA